jgi:hypothetical protein
MAHAEYFDEIAGPTLRLIVGGVFVVAYSVILVAVAFWLLSTIPEFGPEEIYADAGDRSIGEEVDSPVVVAKRAAKLFRSPACEGEPVATLSEGSYAFVYLSPSGAHREGDAMLLLSTSPAHALKRGWGRRKDWTTLSGSEIGLLFAWLRLLIHPVLLKSAGVSLLIGSLLTAVSIRAFRGATEHYLVSSISLFSMLALLGKYIVLGGMAIPPIFIVFLEPVPIVLGAWIEGRLVGWSKKRRYS